MDNQTILLQLEAISRMLTETGSNLGEEISEIRSEVRESESRLEGILAKERKEMEQIEAARKQTEAEEQKQQLTQEIVAAVTAAINPSGQPRRITTPIAAGGTASAASGSFPKEVVELMCEKARLDAQIQSADIQAQIALTDRKRDLNAQLAQLGYAG
jgi:Sec-independent protein translocase protein TatA